MTRVDFYHNAPDRIETAVRIAHKAMRQGMTMTIYAPEAGVSGAIDRALWSLVPQSFMPHCADDNPLAAQTPILLSRDLRPGEAPQHDGLLINLADEIPPGFSRFDRLVELVDSNEAGKALGRERYRHYLDCGYEVSPHDLGGST